MNQNSQKELFDEHEKMLINNLDKKSGVGGLKIPSYTNNNSNNNNNNNNNNNFLSGVNIKKNQQSFIKNFSPSTSPNQRNNNNNNILHTTNKLKSNPMSYDDYEIEDDPIELELRKKMLNMLNQNSIPNNNIHSSNFSLDDVIPPNDEDFNEYSDGNNSSNHSSDIHNNNNNNNNNEYYNNFNNDQMFSTPILSRKSKKNKAHNRSISVNQPSSSTTTTTTTNLLNQPTVFTKEQFNQKSFLTSSNPGNIPTFGSPKFENLNSSIKGTNNNFMLDKDKEKDKDVIIKLDKVDMKNENNNNGMMFSNNGSNISNSSSQSTEDYFNLNEKYLICERERIKSLKNEYKSFEIESERKEIREYKLYAVEEWIFKSNHIWSAVSFTGEVNDKILVSVIRPTQQNKQLYNLISKPPNSTFYQINTQIGQILLANCGDSQQYGLNLIEIPDGDFDEHIEDIKTNLCLKRLGCTNSKYKVSYMKLADSCVDKFRKLSGFPKATKNYVNEFVMEIQAALSHLNYLPLLTKIDGMYDQKTINALKAFQVDSNKRRDGSGLLLLPTEGYLDQITFDELQEEILKLASKLESFGYSVPDSPTKNYKEFNKSIKSFQDNYRIYPDAPGKNILTFIEKMNLKISLTSIPPPPPPSTSSNPTFSTSPKSNNNNNNNNFNNNNINNKKKINNNNNGNKIQPITNNINNNSNLYLNNYDDEIENFKRGQEKTDAEIFRYDDDDDEDEEDEDEFYEEDSDGQDIIDPYVEDDDEDEYFSNDENDHQQQQQPQQSNNTTTTTNTTNNNKSQANSPILNSNNNNNNNNNQKTFQEIQKTQIQPLSNQNVLSQTTQNEINNLEPIAEAEEKEKLKSTILRLEQLVDKQHIQYLKLKEDFDQLSESYYDLKEKSLKSIAIISTNEKMFSDINNRWNKLTKKELPEIEDKINSNVDIIQSYSNKMKRLDDIVTSIQRKSERNILLVFLIAVGSLFIIMITHIALGFTKIKKAMMQPPPLNNNNNNNNDQDGSSIISRNNTSRQDEEVLQDFLNKQKLNISSFFEFNNNNDYDKNK